MLKKIDFSRKRSTQNINFRNTPETITKRFTTIKTFIPILANIKNIVIYIDETAVDENLIPLYGYSQKG